MTLLASRACSRAAGAPDRQTRWTQPAGRSARSRQTVRSPPTVQTSTAHGHARGVAATPAACCARCCPRARLDLCHWLPVVTRCAPRQPHGVFRLLCRQLAHCRHAVRSGMHLSHPVGGSCRCAGCLGGRLVLWQIPMAEQHLPPRGAFGSKLHVSVVRLCLCDRAHASQVRQACFKLRMHGMAWEAWVQQRHASDAHGLHSMS
jgi:hypothetical protein